MINALFCGIYGALASVLGKIALSENVYTEILNVTCTTQFSLDAPTCTGLVFFVRFIVFGCMLLSNAAMIACFLRSMERNASVTVTVVSSAVNYLASGAAGLFIFSEPVGQHCLAGSLCICLGLCLIGVSQEGLPKLRARQPV
jgi:drug/metabolite transporter (DMT)-like permease